MGKSYRSRKVEFEISGENPSLKTLYIPETIDGYKELWAHIENVREKDYEEWRALMRLYSAGDLFFLGNFVATTSGVWDSYRERPFFFCEEHLEFSREVQFYSNGTVYVCARGFGKSTWITFLHDIQQKLRDPNNASVIFSHTREAGTKHLRRKRDEVKNNELLKEIWDDRFFWDPESHKGEASFSLKDGITIKRSTSRPEASFEAHAFVSKLPTGGHWDNRYYDDIEEEEAVATEDAMANIEEKFISSQDLTTKPGYAVVTGTFYHPRGMIRRLTSEMGWRSVVIPGEDLLKRPEDKDEAGPLGGTPYFFTREELFDTINAKGGLKSQRARESYAMQTACDCNAASPMRLKSEWLRRYSDDPHEIGRKMTIYICCDCSPGAVDPTMAWVWGLSTDRLYYWLDGFCKVLAPRDRKKEIFHLTTKWHLIGDLKQIRIEEHGQAEYVAAQIEYNEERGLDEYEVPVVRCNDNRLSKRERAYERWEPNMRGGRILIPNCLPSEDEFGNPIDLVQEFIEKEVTQFPKPISDHYLDAGGLIWEKEDRVDPVEWPRRRKPRRPAPRVKKGTYMSRGML